MLVETAMPRFDSVITEHAVVRADPAATFRAAQNLDFLAVRTPLLTASMWIRGLPMMRVLIAFGSKGGGTM